MIAQRFRAVGYVAMVATAATGLYLISLQVAAERGKLEAVEREIGRAQRDMRQLQTELGTRASMRQLEKWNGEVLALSAPTARQYVRDGAQLVALNLDADASPASAPPPMMAAAAAPKPSTTPPEPVAAEAPAIRAANFVQPAQAPKIQKVAMLEPALASELARKAVQETRKRP